MVKADRNIRELMTCIDRNTKGIALVVDSQRRLICTVTDGDIRRAVLAGIDLDQPIRKFLDLRSPIKSPITAHINTLRSELIKLMNEHSIRHIPLLNDERQVVDLALLTDFVKEYELPLTAVVMAGGFGTRLRPLTEDLPKPMLPVGERPLMEYIVNRLREAGIRQVNITTHYKPEKISDYFGDGHSFGVEINYVSEDLPLGTAGALGLMHPPKEPLLVINGDILTQVDFRAMLDYHRENHADLTMAVRQYNLEVPYGVVECDGPLVRMVREKPKLNMFVNAGIYLLEPVVHNYIMNGQRMDMTELIQRLLEDGHKVVSFPIVEYWRDIGLRSDYEQAQKDVQSWGCVR